MTYFVGKHEFNSRLIVGTGKYPDFETMRKALDLCGAELVTVALRRTNLNAEPGKGLLDFIDRSRFRLLPNTAGCFTEEDIELAVLE